MARTIVLPLRVDLPSAPGMVKGPNNRLLLASEIVSIAAAYWPANELVHCRQIAFAESGWWTGAWAYVGEDSRGLWQLNVDAHPEMGKWDLFDAQVNAFFAHQLWQQQGWKPWSSAKTLGIT